jgi:hypothetical protein
VKQTEHSQKHPRGSSPQPEIQLAFDSWVKNLRAIEGTPESQPSLTGGVEQPVNTKIDFHAQEPDIPKQAV